MKQTTSALYIHQLVKVINWQNVNWSENSSKHIGWQCLTQSLHSNDCKYDQLRQEFNMKTFSWKINTCFDSPKP